MELCISIDGPAAFVVLDGVLFGGLAYALGIVRCIRAWEGVVVGTCFAGLAFFFI